MENKADLILAYQKDGWVKGEWDNEPDRVDFIHAGFSCFILRNGSGNWCGYVGVPETHSAFGKHDAEVDVDVHGGITYADICSPPICHIPEPNMPEKVWWLGFDTAHSGDYTPSMSRYSNTREDVYRNVEYVTNEVKRLAEQLAEMK